MQLNGGGSKKIKETLKHILMDLCYNKEHLRGAFQNAQVLKG
ncbi:hypothetical protein [Helicobacter pylori]